MKKILLLIVAVLAAYTAWSYLPSAPISVPPAQSIPVYHAPIIPTYTHDALVDQRLNELGIKNTAEIQILLTDQVVCGNPKAISCYLNKLISLRDYSSLSIEEQRVTLAHEYLHYIWSTQPSPELTGDLEAIYNSNPALRYRMRVYANLDHAGLVNEMHSIIGTEVADSEMPPVLLAHYKQYISNRSALPSRF